MNKEILRKFTIIFGLTLFMLLSLTATKTYAANIGTVLKNPENGWTRYDDAYVTGTIPPGTSPNYYRSTGKWTQTPGQNITFDFYGNQIRLLTYTSKEHASEVSITIDGVPYTYSEQYNTGTLTLVFEKTGLETGFHEIVIESVQSGVWTSLDAIDLNQGGYIVPINTPSQLTASPGSSQAILSWKEVQDATNYTIYYGTKPGNYTETVSVTKDAYANYVIPGLTNGTTYYFAVTATVNGVESERSKEASATPLAGEQPNPEPEQPSGNRAIMVVTMTTGLEKEFDLSMKEVHDFIAWYEAKQAGSGKASYALDKHVHNKGPFSSRKDYILYDRVLTFEVSEY
ncbi:fibronectin type III domain-containing protein [Paenibacillus sp. FSL K6-1230]|uniref:fibronectin type III domain-containing protein n=1 Tax=Paenibacillus sp. FSL K6-1230 TaxID=2921603 RepID=UPI0030FADAEC